jgi:hypothetical protein
MLQCCAKSGKLKLRQCQKRNSSLNTTTLPAIVDDFLGPALPKLPTAQQSDIK